MPSQDPIEQYYEVQKIEGVPRRIEPSVAANPGADVVQSVTYLVSRDSPSNSTSREKILDDGTEVILLLQKEEPARRHQRETTTADRRVIELSDKDCTLALRRQFEMTKAVEREGDATTSRVDKNAEMLRKLPADTIVTTQKEARASKLEDNGDYKELTEVGGDGGSGSTSGCAAAKVKRIPRAVRNKT